MLLSSLDSQTIKDDIKLAKPMLLDSKKMISNTELCLSKAQLKRHYVRVGTT